MKTIKSLKEITTLEVGDKVIFGCIEYIVCTPLYGYTRYYLGNCDLNLNNSIIFEQLHINKEEFLKDLGIIADTRDFPEVKSLEALTAIVSALFKEYEKQNELPKTWEEFCKRNKNIPVFKLTTGSSINTDFLTHSSMDKNTCCSHQEAEAFLALMQLRQLRKAYVKDWEPDWKDTKQYKAIIMYNGIDFVTVYFKDLCSRPLSFPTHELAIQFFNNFKDLLEVAKPLL